MGKFAPIIYQPHPIDPKSLSPEEHKQIGADYARVNSSPGVTPAAALGYASKAMTVRVTDGELATSAGSYAGDAYAVGGFMMREPRNWKMP